MSNSNVIFFVIWHILCYLANVIFFVIWHNCRSFAAGSFEFGALHHSGWTATPVREVPTEVQDDDAMR